MGRRTIWERTVKLRFEVPEDTDDPYQLPRVEFEVDGSDGWPGSNSVKVGSLDEAVGSLLGDLAVYLQREGVPLQAELDRGFAARVAWAESGDE